MSGQRDRAEQRLATLARQLERVGLADLRVVTHHDQPGRDEVRRRATDAVTRAGLGEVWSEARGRFRDWVQSAYNRLRSDPYYAPLGGLALGPVDDRLDVFLAVDDAVLATVASELVADDDREALFEPYARMMAFGPWPGPADQG